MSYYLRQAFRKSVRASVPLTLAIAGVFQAIPVKALTFTFNAAPSIDSRALAGFQAAGNLWSSLFTDNVTVNIDIGFESLEAGVLGQTLSQSKVFSYSDIENALRGDRTSSDDETAVANLPGVGGAFTFLGTEEDGAFEIDGIDGLSIDNAFLDVNTANAKALGLLANDGSADATITFNSDFNFDFDRSNGIDGSSFDFIGIAAHEIGHALGFVSGVDTVDFFSGSGPGAPLDLDDEAIFSVLDMFRHSSDSVFAAYQFDIPVVDLAADTFPKYFSIDGGITNLGEFSSGTFNGDGNQASHWQDNSGLGLMDPTGDYGELLRISNLDLRAFDAIGWDRQAIPEPGTILGSLALGAGFLLKQKAKRG